jgi:hypothetical protein
MLFAGSAAALSLNDITVIRDESRLFGRITGSVGATGRFGVIDSHSTEIGR